jgi:4-hydroxyphenylpyruvate dioxygenase
VVRRAAHANVGTILDTFHILARGTDLSTIGTIPKESIFLVQAADAPRLDMDLLSWSRHWRCMPGQGDLALDAFMEALGATGYDGYLSLEIFNDRFRAGSARAVAIDGRRSLLTLLDDTAPCVPPPAGRGSRLPPRAPVEAVEFIEFAVDEIERPGFETLLRGMGFTQVGLHRSKDVALWMQGDIRIVLNGHKEGFAHSYYVSHGASVCAIALRVPDAQATIARATALLDTPYAGAVGPGELDIPAVRGLGGSLVYFLDTSSGLGRWSENDFVLTASTVEGAGLLAVDHISQTMQYEEMLTWLLFYTSLLVARKTPTQAVIDPGGVVQSQVIESGAKGATGLRLVLNGSQSHRSLSGRFMSEFFGSGVQNIALSSADIRATVRRLVAGGIEMLPIPENYYDDLDARFDIPAEMLKELASLNILYDRDGGGEFLQAYTKSLPDGFFFEIVQRDGYAGYGAPNAGIRLAAQARQARPEAIPRF